MAAVSAAKVASIAAKALLTRDEERTSGLTKLVIGVAAGVFVFLLLLYAAVQIFLLPMSSLVEFFLPSSIAETKSALGEVIVLPPVDTPKVSLMAYPVDEKRISSGYGSRFVAGRPDLSRHEGIDFPVAFDTPVMAVAPGKVVDTGVSNAYGSYILIEHKLYRYDRDGRLFETEVLYSFYAHLHKIYVFEEQLVGERQQIALSGGDPTRHFAGNTTGAHLHLELRTGMAYGTDFDPYAYVQNPHPFRGRTKSIRWGYA